MLGPFFGLHVISGKKLFNFWWRPFFWSSLKYREKNFSIFGEELFFVFTWFAYLKKIVVEVHPPPQCWKSSKIGVKLQIIPLNAQQRSAPLTPSKKFGHLYCNTKDKLTKKGTVNLRFKLLTWNKQIKSTVLYWLYYAKASDGLLGPRPISASLRLRAKQLLSNKCRSGS